MYILPAIDLKDRKVVRLYKGDFNTVHQVAQDPLETARAFSEAGARWIHMVDLDGARGGTRINGGIVAEVTARSGLQVELGGGIRCMEDLEAVFQAGVGRAVIGSAAVSDPDFVRAAAERYGERVAVGIDTQDGRVRTAGWVEDSGLDYLEFAKFMMEVGVKNIIFSSSATVYGDPAEIPITEKCPKGQCTNPYGWTKSMLEQILTDIQFADKEWNVILLRYFNPIGAHKSGLIGEDPNGIPNNLMPYITKVATGELPRVNVFGNDYPTPDGTGVRDYIHVMDLATGHVNAIDKIKENPGVKVYNLGTGKGYSVLDVIKNFSEASGIDIPYVITDRRPGDIAECYSDATLAKEELGWEAKYDIKEMCADSWNWQKNNPNGYR